MKDLELAGPALFTATAVPASNYNIYQLVDYDVIHQESVVLRLMSTLEPLVVGVAKGGKNQLLDIIDIRDGDIYNKMQVAICREENRIAIKIQHHSLPDAYSLMTSNLSMTADINEPQLAVQKVLPYFTANLLG